MNSRLYYKLGLEELEEPEVTNPVTELQGSQLEADQLHHELQEDTSRLDALHVDTKTMEEVQMGLEAALKNASADRTALSFAQKAVQMVDKRWGFGYPIPSMEDNNDMAVVTSMEDGVGQRLKDMGKALLEMLKKIWAKLKEWGNKVLQALGLKKKKLQEIEERAERIEQVVEGKLPPTDANLGKAPSATIHATVVEEHKQAQPVQEAAPAKITLPAPEKAAEVIPESGKKVPHYYDRLIHRGKNPAHIGDFKAGITAIAKVLELMNVYNSHLDDLLHEIQRLPLEKHEDIDREVRQTQSMFISEGFYDTSDANTAFIAGGTGNTLTHNLLIPGNQCVYLEKTNSYQGNVLPEIRVGNTRAGARRGKVEYEEVVWMPLSDVRPATVELGKLVNLLTKTRKEVSDNFEKISKQALALEERFSIDEKTSQAKLKFINNVVTLYTRYHITFSQELYRYVDGYCSACFMYLQDCEDFWVNYIKSEKPTA